MRKGTNRHFRGAKERNHVRSLREQPRERDLSRGSVVPLANLGERVGELQQLGEVLRRVPVAPRQPRQPGIRGNTAHRGIIRRKSSAAKPSGLFCIERRGGTHQQGPFVCTDEKTRAHDVAREHAAAERRVRDDDDAEFARGAQQVDLLVLDVKRDRRVLDLECSDGVDRVGAPERRCRAFGYAEVFHFAVSIRAAVSTPIDMKQRHVRT